MKLGPSWWPLRSGIPEDVKGRLGWYQDDWREGLKSRFGILAPSVYIFFCSAIPALAFGQQFFQETDGTLTVVHTLIATGLAGIIQAVIGGQPLLIVGVAEPIVLTYSYMYNFAKDRLDLGRDLFLAWAAWTCLWAGIMILVLAMSGACRYIHLFTRFSGEVFGALIAVLFLQEAIRGIKQEFGTPSGPEQLSPQALLKEWRLVNGLWGLFLSFGLLLTSLLVRQARSWRFGVRIMRSLLADYGVPLMVLLWSGLAYAVAAPSPEGIPRRTQLPQVWEVRTSWSTAARMGQVPGKYIAAALIPAILITILFYFDHSVSSQLAQLPEFNVVKPSAYNYDFALLGVITIAFGLIGLPPINGVLPQAPMHTRSLITVKENATLSKLRKVARKHKGENRSTVLRAVATRAGEIGSTSASAIWRLLDDEAAEQLENGDSPDCGIGKGGAADGSMLSPPLTGGTAGNDRACSIYSNGNRDDGGNLRRENCEADVVAGAKGEATTGRGFSREHEEPSEDGAMLTSTSNEVDIDHEIGRLLTIQTSEQRVSNLIQSLLCGLLVGVTPGIKLIPSPILWGYFAFMAIDSLPGSQLWDRLLLLGTDSTKYSQLDGDTRPYLGTVPMGVIALFTLLQVGALGVVYGYTWAGIAGIAFPIFIMALVPLRRFILPKIIKMHHLQHLDPAPYESYKDARCKDARCNNDDSLHSSQGPLSRLSDSNDTNGLTNDALEMPRLRRTMNSNI